MKWFFLGLIIGFVWAFELGRAVYNRKMDDIQKIAQDMEKSKK